MSLLIQIESMQQQLRWALFKVCPACAVRWRNGLQGESSQVRIFILQLGLRLHLHRFICLPI